MKTNRLLFRVERLSIIALLFMLGLVSGWTDNGNLAQNITGCGTLNTTNAVYTQTQNIINIDVPCIRIVAKNATYDGNSFLLRTSFLVLNASITIKNTNFTGTSITFIAMDYNYTRIINNIFTGYSEVVPLGNNISVENNIFISNRTSSVKYGGIRKELGYGPSATNISIINNTFTSLNPDNAKAYEISSGSYGYWDVGWTIINNIFSSKYPIYLLNSQNFLLKNNLFANNTINAITLISSHNNLLKNSSFNNLTCPLNLSFLYEPGLNVNNTLLNISIDGINITNDYISESCGRSYMYWWVDFQVNDTLGGAIENTIIDIYNNGSNYQSQGLTSSLGNLSSRYLLHGNRSYSTIFSKAGYETSSIFFNLTGNALFNITLSPSVSVSLISPSNSYAIPLNYTFTCSALTSSPRNLSNITIYIWNSTNSIVNMTTSNITGIQNNFSLNISLEYSGSYKWNCYACTNQSECKFADSNNSASIFTSALTVLLSYNNFFFSIDHTTLNFYIIDYQLLEPLAVYAKFQLWSNWTGIWNKSSEGISTLRNFGLGYYFGSELVSSPTLSDGCYKWNVWANRTYYEGFGGGGDGNWAPNNFTFCLDTIPPKTDFNVHTTIGTQTVKLDTNVIDINLNTSSCKYAIYNQSGSIETFYNNLTINCTATDISATVSKYSTFNLTLYAADNAQNSNVTTKTFTVSSISPSGGGGGGPTIIITSNRTYCGDKICQRNGNDNNETEDFYFCPQDCPGFNLDAVFFGCFSNDPSGKCVWWQESAKYIGFFVGLFVLLIIFSKVEYNGKQVPTYKYAYYRVQKFGKKRRKR